MTKYLLTTIAWVESIAKKELEKIGVKNIVVTDKSLVFEWDETTMINANLWSRVWNKVYMILSEWKVENFDDLYDLVSSFDYKKIYKSNFPIIVNAKSINSLLVSIPAIQSISKKAIIDNITNKSVKILKEDELEEKLDIFVIIQNNYAKILLNTSWEALHKRWYREDTWVAPIKESLAAALVLLSDWKFKSNFYDLFCGSATIAIEAAMIAKNIAPWLYRYFAFERLNLVSKDIVQKQIEIAKTKQYVWDYKIIASDIDENILNIAKQNAKNAWVLDMIEFQNKDFRDFIDKKLTWTIVSNPPYWERLKDENIVSLYKNIDKLFRLNPDLWWWIITSFLDFDNLIDQKNYKKRKLYNGWELTYFYKRLLNNL